MNTEAAVTVQRCTPTKKRKRYVDVESVPVLGADVKEFFRSLLYGNTPKDSKDK